MSDLARFMSIASAEANFRWLMNLALLPIKVFSIAPNALFFIKAPATFSTVTMARITVITPSPKPLPATRATMNSTMATTSLISP